MKYNIFIINIVVNKYLNFNCNNLTRKCNEIHKDSAEENPLTLLLNDKNKIGKRLNI